jgi:flavin-dependent dehydrogenase
MKVVIVGGGTAGWLCAALFANQNKLYKEDNLPEIDVTVIESSDIPIIGSGEGTTALMQQFVASRFKALGKTELDFFKGSLAMPKYGIRFKDWNGVGTEFLSPIQPSETAAYNLDTAFLSAALEGNYYDSSISGYFMGKGLTDFHINNKQNMNIHAYHFDAHKVGEYFKKVCIENGVTHIDATVDDINVNSTTGECDSVKLNGIDIPLSGDFWIDCTGFHRKLINKMGAKWISYSDELPTNSALPYLHQYEKGPEEAKLETLAWSMPNGWMWQIPTQKRYGCGYVYSDRFVSDDQALAELQSITGRKIEPIRKLKFDAGRLDKFWIKNVVAIGLSSSFLEPLQATSIHTSLIQLDTIFSSYFSFDKNEFFLNQNIEKYNNFMSFLIDEYKDLIRIHYHNKRNDSEFWRYCNNELAMSDNVKNMIEVCKYRSPSNFDFSSYHGSSGWGVWCWTLYGLGTLPKSSMINSLKKFSSINYTKQIHSNTLEIANKNSSVLQTQPNFISNLINNKLSR